MEFSRVKIEVYLPETHLDVVRTAMAAAGAGRVGLYEECSSVSGVSGTWRPLPGASPYDGQVGVLNAATECKLEMLCSADKAAATVAAARSAHPYEEAVINVIPLWAPKGA